MRELDNITQTGCLRRGMEGNRITYKAPIKDNGLQSVARGVSQWR